MYYTVIKHSGHLRTLEKCRKHSPAARVFYISLVFSNARRVLSQCNTRLRLLYSGHLRTLEKCRFRTNKYDLRGFCKLDQPTYFSGFMHRSYQYVTTRLWNNLSDYVRRAPSLNIFKSMLDEVNLTTRVECDCNFCT